MDYEPKTEKDFVREMIKFWRLSALIDIVGALLQFGLAALLLKTLGPPWGLIGVINLAVGVMSGRSFLKSLDKVDAFKERLRELEKTH